MGEAVYYVRRALYELRCRKGKEDGASQNQDFDYIRAQKWPVPSVRQFDAATERLRRLGRIRDTSGGDENTRLYRLTTDGELEEEEQRRPWAKRVFDELRRPANAAKLVYALVGAVLGSVATVLAQRFL